jgi:hypothetical protein
MHFDVFLSEVWPRHHPADPPPLLLGLIAIQITRGWDKSHWVVVCSLAQRRSGFQSVSGLGLC